MKQTTCRRLKRSQFGSRYQRGHAPFAENIFVLFIGAFLLFAAITVAIPTFFAFRWRSVTAGLISAGVAIIWLYLFITEIALPASREKAYNEWASGAAATCSQELAALPGRILGTSLLDETAGLSRKQIIQLFAERGLAFVEVKPSLLEADKAPRIAVSGEGGQGDGSWRLPGLTAPYVRLRLSSTADPACNPSLDRHGTLRMPPFMPETCIAVDPIEQPSADLAIVLKPAARAALGEYGSREVVRRQTQEVLARLTTSEAAGQPYYGAGDGLTSLDGIPKRSNCRNPYGTLVDLVSSSEADWLNHSDRVLKIERVKVGKSFEEVFSLFEQYPVVQAAAESHVFLTEEEKWDLFDRTIRAEEWAKTVIKASSANPQRAPYGPHLLDLGGRTLIQLDHGWPFPWKVHAVLDGFFLIDDNRKWDSAPRNLLVRFRADGEFEWAVTIAPPSVQSIGPIHSPAAIFIEGRSLIFATPGRLVTPEDSPPPAAKIRSVRWEVPLARLPATAPFHRGPAQGAGAGKGA